MKSLYTSLLILLVLYTSRFCSAAECAGDGQQALECDAKGNKPANCCPGTECGQGGSSKWCYAITPTSTSDGFSSTVDAGARAVKVSCIVWYSTSGQDKHIHAEAFVVYVDTGEPVVGALVRLELQGYPEDGSAGHHSIHDTTTMDHGGHSGESCGFGYNAGVTEYYCILNAPTGVYTASILNVSMNGCTYDPTSGITEETYSHVAPS